MLPFAMESTTTVWDFFNTQQDKVSTFFTATSPFWIAILFTWFCLASVRNLYGVSDKVSFALAFVVAGVSGGLCVTFIGPTVNDIFKYNLYHGDFFTIGGAVIITGILNHILFRLLVLVLVALWFISDAVPSDSKWSWLGVPGKQIARFIYFSLTGKSFEDRKGKPDKKEDKKDDGNGNGNGDTPTEVMGGVK